MLRHRHLPALARLNLLEWDDDAATIARGSHPVWDHSSFQSGLSADDERWTAAVTVHSDPERRAVAWTLADAESSTTRAALAREILAKTEDRPPRRTAAHDVAVALHHTHLPKLDAVGVLTYDAATGTVSAEDGLEVPHFQPGDPSA
jgi:hypothetical protein